MERERKRAADYRCTACYLPQRSCAKYHARDQCGFLSLLSSLDRGASRACRVKKQKRLDGDDFRTLFVPVCVCARVTASQVRRHRPPVRQTPGMQVSTYLYVPVHVLIMHNPNGTPFSTMYRCIGKVGVHRRPTCSLATWGCAGSNVSIRQGIISDGCDIGAQVAQLMPQRKKHMCECGCPALLDHSITMQAWAISAFIRCVMHHVGGIVS